MNSMDTGSVCYSCDKSFVSIGRHWGLSSSCDPPQLTQHQEEVITGLLMSDGWIHKTQEESHNPRFECSMKAESLPYLEYIDGAVFPEIGLGVKMTRTAEEAARDVVKRGFHPKAEPEDYSDIYTFSTRRHPELEEFDEWYNIRDGENREKIWPSGDIELTPTVLKHLYVGDGTWDNTHGRNRIMIAMGNEVNRRRSVGDMFRRAGFPVSNFTFNENNEDKKMTAEFTVSTSKEMFEYMGEPLPGFEYKWPVYNEGDK